MTRTTLLALAERVEAATGADRELDAHVHCVREGLTFVLIGTGNEAYGDICDPSDSGCGSKNTTVRGTLYARYPDNKNPPTLGGGRRGNIVQGCEPARYTASLDAAMSLVPSGWNIATAAGQNDNGTWFSELRRGYRTSYDAVALSSLKCATPALALTAACLRARAIAGSLTND